MPGSSNKVEAEAQNGNMSRPVSALSNHVALMPEFQIRARLLSAAMFISMTRVLLKSPVESWVIPSVCGLIARGHRGSRI